MEMGKGILAQKGLLFVILSACALVLALNDDVLVSGQYSNTGPIDSEARLVTTSLAQIGRTHDGKLETDHTASLMTRKVRAIRNQRPSIHLAQRPKFGRTTTSTTTSASPATTSTEQIETSGVLSKSGTPANEIEDADAEEADESGDYEPINGGSQTTSTTSRPTSSTLRAPKQATSKRPGKKGAKFDSTAKTTTTTTTTTTSSTSSSVSDEQEEYAEEGEEAETSEEGEEDGENKGVSGVTEMVANNENENDEEVVEHKATSRTVVRQRPNATAKSTKAHSIATSSVSNNSSGSKHTHKPLVALPFIKPKDASVCISEAFLEFPSDLFGDKWRSRGFVIIHLLVVCYMFYALALVCERYFMPSLEEFAQRWNLSEDVAGATLMSAGSSAPELFTAILGVFVTKGDVGTGAIVGSAVFNILFVIGLCAFVSTTTARLQWWPVLRDCIYYTFTVLVLIIIIYDERVTALESFIMLALYGVYILIMAHNETLKQIATRLLVSHPITAKIVGASSTLNADGPDDVFGSSSSATSGGGLVGSLLKTGSRATGSKKIADEQIQLESKQSKIENDSMYLAALLIIIKHKRLFRNTIRFQSAARYVIVKMQHKRQKSAEVIKQQHSEADYFESSPLQDQVKSNNSLHLSSQRAKMEAYAHGGTMSKNKFSIVSREDYEFWNMPPAEGENYYLWLAKIPANYVLHYTIPDCTLYPDKYIYTFFISILWTAFFSYIMVWMVTLIGYTFGIPDSVMGVTFLAAGTSVPDCYSSIHAARNGMADMAVSNSIGSNVFDILIGLAFPWFIQSAIYPGIVATINSRGVIYSVILLFLSLIVTIYLLNKYEWSLQPRLGLALLLAYGLFIILTCMLEFNLFGHVNPPPCPVPANRI